MGTIINGASVTVDLNRLRGCADVELRGLPGSSAQDALTTLLLRVGDDYAYGWSALYKGDREAYLAAWIEYYEWLDGQEWGPDSELTGAEQFKLMVDKLRELGLPVHNPGA